jgi:hypothetical protein
MIRLIFSPPRLCCLALAVSFSLSAAIAQEANVLGLPVVPQPKPGTAASAAKGASAPKTSPDAPASRDILAGELGLQHSALNGIGRLIVTTRASFATAVVQSNAMDAARAVQRELGKACAKQCKPEKMTAPKILPSGQLEFELAFSPLYQHLNQAQFVAALQSKPLNLTPAQLTAPVAVPSTVSVSIVTSSAPPPSTATK